MKLKRAFLIENFLSFFCGVALSLKKLKTTYIDSYELVEGVDCFPRLGIYEKGRFEFTKELDEMYLVEGDSVTNSWEFKNVSFEYNKELHEMVMVKGEQIAREKGHYTGYVFRGDEWQYMDKGGSHVRDFVKKGSIIFPHGEIWEGEFGEYEFLGKITADYSFGKFVFKGSITTLKGVKEEGSWNCEDTGYEMRALKRIE